MHRKKTTSLIKLAILVSIGTSACGWFPTKDKGEKARENDAALAGLMHKTRLVRLRLPAGHLEIQRCGRL